jgi:hypothetical protein
MAQSCVWLVFGFATIIVLFENVVFRFYISETLDCVPNSSGSYRSQLYNQNGPGLTSALGNSLGQAIKNSSVQGMSSTD